MFEIYLLNICEWICVCALPPCKDKQADKQRDEFIAYVITYAQTQLIV